MSKIFVIILAGGQGLRMGEKMPKQFLSLGKYNIIQQTCLAFAEHPEVDYIIAVSPGEHIVRVEEMLSAPSEGKLKAVCQGGATRQGSASNGISACDARDDDILLLHDAARPFVDHDCISNVISSARENGAAGLYIKAVDTITEIRSGMVVSIPPREHLYYTQTPQAFQYKVIKKAHDTALARGVNDATDDVSLVLECGMPVAFVEGSRSNLKITSPEDYDYALYLMKKR